MHVYIHVYIRTETCDGISFGRLFAAVVLSMDAHEYPIWMSGSRIESGDGRCNLGVFIGSSQYKYCFLWVAVRHSYVLARYLVFYHIPYRNAYTCL